MPVLKSESMTIRSETDVVLVRQAVRKWAAGQGFSLVDQTKIVTAASELARNTLIYGGGGSVRLESLVEGLKDYPQVIVNVKVHSKPPLDTIPEVAQALAEAQSALGDNGRIVLRYSGTEPLARVMVEAEHQADVQRFSQSVANALRSSIGV